MATFWVLIVVALVGVIIYAAFADRAARKAGQVLVPTKTNRFGRTTFVRMDRAELDEQKAAAILAEQERQRGERARMGDGVQTAKMFGGLFGDTSRRLRKR